MIYYRVALRSGQTTHMVLEVKSAHLTSFRDGLAEHVPLCTQGAHPCVSVFLG